MRDHLAGLRPARGLVLVLVLLFSGSFLGCAGDGDDRNDGGLADGLSDGEQDGLADGDLDDGGGDQPSDAGDGDGADDGDGGGDPGDGPEPDGGDEPADQDPDPVVLELSPVLSWQRGPVRLPFTVYGPEGQVADVSFAYSTDGVSFQPATALPNTLAQSRDLLLSITGVSGRFVWDSMRNIEQDEPQTWVRASVRVDGTVVESDTLGPFDLHNAQDFERLVVVPHPYGVDLSGSPEPGSLASLLYLASDGSLSDSGSDLVCGDAPALAGFTADGRFGVILAEGDGHNKHSLTPFQVDRAGTASPLGQQIDLYALGLSVSDLLPAPDGSGIWMVHYTGQGGLFFLSFSEALPALATDGMGNHHLLPITLPGSMGLVGDNRRALISGGALSIDDPPYDLTLVDLEAGSVLDQQVAGVGSLADRVAVTSDGTQALVPAPDPWSAGPDLVLSVSLDGDQISGWSSSELGAPAWVKIHPLDGAALVTSWDNDCVYVLNLGVDPPLLSQTVNGVALADHLDCVVQGALMGLCLVSAVEELESITLHSDASASRGTSFSLGSGYSAITSGPAIQP